MVKGFQLPSLNHDKLFNFQPEKTLKKDCLISGGDVLGLVFENSLFRNHKILADPRVQGKVVEVFEEGNYKVTDPICIIETPTGAQEELCMRQLWPLRTPRPFVEKLEPKLLNHTGARVFDTWFPMAQGGTCVYPDNPKYGKTAVDMCQSKYSNTDCMIYVSCNESVEVMQELVEEFQCLEVIE